MKTTSDAEMQTMLEEEREKLRVARMIYQGRTTAGLTMAELRLLTRTASSAIVRLEDADYEGDALILLARIACSLDQRLEVRLVPRQSETVNAAA